jgi:two-component system sensor histidine kinase AlgZ
MHPIFGQKRRFGEYVAACTPLGVPLALLFAKRGGFSPGEAAALAAPMVLLLAVMALSAWYPCRSVPLSPSNTARIGSTHAVASVVVSGLWVLAGAGFAGLFDWAMPAPVSFGLRYGSQVPALFLIGILVYLLSAALHYVYLSLEEAREAERRGSAREILKREAELTALKAQIQPHFLFNSLNSISSLTSTDPARAREMCVSLADFLRKTLAVEERESIPIGEELSLVRSYLDVERIRFGARLNVEEQIAPEENRWLVPPLLLQPLIENAVLHGIGTLVEGGIVRIEVARAGHRVRIVVSNPFDPNVVPARPRGGLGLRLVRDRLRAAYGGDAILATKRLEGVHLAILSIPVRSAA